MISLADKIIENFINSYTGSADFQNSIQESIESDLERKYSEYGVSLNIADMSDFIELSKIVVPKEKRGSGVGSKVMQDLIKYADKNNKDIFLTPSTDFGGTKARLVKFYKSFGFVPNKGKKKDYRSQEALVRFTK